jgi:hypothetical protein
MDYFDSMNEFDENHEQQVVEGSGAITPAVEPPAVEAETDEPAGPVAQRTPRVFIRETIIRRLVKGGVSNDIASIGKAVNDLLDYTLTSHQAEMVNMADVVAIEQSLSDRLEELTATNIALARLLYDLGAVIEVDRIFGSFNAIAKSRVPANAQPAPRTPEPKPVINNPTH